MHQPLTEYSAFLVVGMLPHFDLLRNPNKMFRKGWTKSTSTIWTSSLICLTFLAHKGMPTSPQWRSSLVSILTRVELQGQKVLVMLLLLLWISQCHESFSSLISMPSISQLHRRKQKPLLQRCPPPEYQQLHRRTQQDSTSTPNPATRRLTLYNTHQFRPLLI
jgi:hypothetical protein